MAHYRLPIRPAFYSGPLLRMKRPEEATAQIQRAIELDPLNPSFRALYCNSLVRVRRYDEAILQCRNALTTTPDAGPALTGLGLALHLTGRYKEPDSRLVHHHAY